MDAVACHIHLAGGRSQDRSHAVADVHTREVEDTLLAVAHTQEVADARLGERNLDAVAAERRNLDAAERAEAHTQPLAEVAQVVLHKQVVDKNHVAAKRN